MGATSCAWSAGWTTQFQHVGPASAFANSDDQVTVDALGTATSIQTVGYDPGDSSKRDLVILRTGTTPGSFRRQNPDSPAYWNLSVTATGTRTFAAVTLTTTSAPQQSCWLLEIGNTGVISETQLTTGAANACQTIVANSNRLFVVTTNDQVLITDFSGQILSTVTLNTAEAFERRTAIAGNGDLILTERISTSAGDSKLTTSRISATGNLLWQQDTDGLTYNSRFVQSVAPSGDLVLAFTLDQMLSLKKLNAAGQTTASIQSATGSNDGADLCVINDDAYTFSRSDTAVTIQKVQFTSGTSLVASVPIASEWTPSPFARCNNQRIFLSLAGNRRHDLTVLSLAGEVIKRTKLSDRLDFHFFAQNAEYVALLSSKPTALFAAGLKLSVYKASGDAKNSAEVGEFPIAPAGLQLVASENNGVALATHAFGAIAVHDVQRNQRRWTKQVRSDYREELNVFPFRVPIEMARLGNGSTDVMSGDGYFHLLRFTSNGNEVARHQLHYYDGFDSIHELRHLADGSILTIASGVTHLIQNGVATELPFASLSITGESRNSLKLVGFVNQNCDFSPICDDFEPHNYVAQLTPQLGIVPGTYSRLPYDLDTHRLHSNGYFDLIGYGGGPDHAGVSRFALNGTRVFGPTIPVPGTTGHTISYAVHPELGQVVALKSTAAPNTSSILARISAQGTVLWTITLPFRADQLALDDVGRVGVTGYSGSGRFLRIFESDGSVWQSEDCMDRQSCAYAPNQVAQAGTRWFASGTSTPLSGESVRQVYVREYDTSLFEHGFE
ncbi:hypothetical protein C7S18_13845 [Ahniella affigens]|uniref:Uncharacterized protein n=2 Tax=Ahniella affigens TaxID=2021234 RepID=A0A2P1PTP0_9GAMM|nr:hypothetical protein C7S18_13845 [Ahniella affigens]